MAAVASKPAPDPPPLEPGEVLVGHAVNTVQVLHGGSAETISGTLFVTNYQLCFKPGRFLVDKLSPSDRVLVKASEFVPLMAISHATTVSSGRRRQLNAKGTMPKKISELEIVCKDIRKLTFNFKSCAKSDAINVVSSLGMYSTPNSIYYLFPFDYARVVRSSKEQFDAAPSFHNPRDWQKELDRLGVNQKQWRVTQANNKFLLCESLPPYIVVPYNISDDTLEYAASLHSDNRLPVWCWSHPTTGVSLTRASLPDEDRLEAPDPSYMYAVSMARNLDVQVENKQTAQFNLSQSIPGTVRELYVAYSKLSELCLSTSLSEASKADPNWLAGLDSSKWMYFVRSCLDVSGTISETLCCKRIGCLILGPTDRDFSCVVSSLVQVMVDPHYRTMSGFESLIQKEWIAMGHPFTTRRGLIIDDTELQLQAPVFLLFCDCVWQLTQQFVSAFQFSPLYLVQLYSVVVGSKYGSFLFNSARDRLQASLHSKRSSYYATVQDDQYGRSEVEQYEGPLIPAWGNWRSSLSAEESELWLNPFYYIFGSSDAHGDYCFSGSPLPFESSHFNSLFPDMLPNAVDGGNFGLYYDQPLPNSPTPSTKSSKISRQESYQMGVLIPSSTVTSLSFWYSYFFRYAPEFAMIEAQYKTTHVFQSKLVKEVRRLKECLNEIELELGAQATDLSGFIGQIMQAKEEERIQKIEKLFDSSRPVTHRLSAYASFNSVDEDEKQSNRSSVAELKVPILSFCDKSKSLPTQSDESLSKFADALYGKDSPKSIHEKLLTSSTEGRSPVLKTKITVQKEEETVCSPTGSVNMKWIGTASLIPPHQSPIMPSPPIVPLHKKTSGIVEGNHTDELTEL